MPGNGLGVQRAVSPTGGNAQRGAAAEDTMRLHHVLTTAASLATLSLAAPAFAQSPAPPLAGGDPMTSQEPVTGPMTEPVDDSMDPASDIAGSAGQTAVIPLSSPTPVEQAYMLKAGDQNVVSNAPVPDTPSTRAQTGGPDSNGGRQTRPVGN